MRDNAPCSVLVSRPIREPRIATMVGLTRTANEVLLIWLAVALTIGITLAVLMGRRGHSAFEWFLIGAILGRIALPLAWGRIGLNRLP